MLRDEKLFIFSLCAYLVKLGTKLFSSLSCPGCYCKDSATSHVGSSIQ